MKIDPALNPTTIAQNGLNQGANRLGQISHEIASSIKHSQPTAAATETPAINASLLDEMNARPASSLEDNLVNLHLTKHQMLSLTKVLEVENQLFDDALGRIFDTKV